MKKRHLTLAILAGLMSAGGGQSLVYAGHDEDLQSYTIDTIVVEAERTVNQFGDTVTEQSYYRTGGDVKVITREEIEKRHYTDLTEAIKRIPGVTFQNPGYRGGEYGYQFYNNGVIINGDSRVIILIDGRRVDNLTSERIGNYSTSGSKSTGVNLDQLLGIESVDKIEVIKGPGASVYGPDATGGVINIITRKGAVERKGTLDLSTGSWHKHNYSLTLSGSIEDDPTWHYFGTVTRAMSGDTEYTDGETGTTGTLGGSRWKEDAVNIRFDKDLSDEQSIKLWYNHKSGKDGYPISTPRLKYWNQDDWERIIFGAAIGQLDANNALKGAINPDTSEWEPEDTLTGATDNPGYANLFALDGKVYRSFSKFKHNDWELKWTFDKDNGMESFLRLYDQNHRYSNRDKFAWRDASRAALVADYRAKFPLGATKAQLKQWISDHLAPFPGGDPAKVEAWLNKTGGMAPEPTSWFEERNRGVQVQYARAIGKNDVIASLTYDKAKTYEKRIMADGSVRESYTARDSVLAYVQDKIHITNKWDITPALRYSYYAGYDSSTAGSALKGRGNGSLITPTLNTEYLLDDTLSMYFGWTRIYRPLRSGDYTEVDGVFMTPLEDERGNVWTLGVRKDFSKDTSLAVHYDWTRMSNAIATLPIWDSTTDSFESTAVNAREDKKSFNVTFDHAFDKHFSMSASYTHMEDKWMAKPGWILDPNWGYQGGSDINTQINHLRPQNHYALNLSYEQGKVYTGMLMNWYTGCNRTAFTANQFFIIDWNFNYRFTSELTGYITVNNLTNEGYQTSYNEWSGIGSASMPGRSIMVGARYTF
ncbi:MAG: TonB-dependent receptor domain-containing protein [Schwartzia sp. (in: firmicutes)]